MRRVIIPIASAAMVLAATQVSWGLINPKFTPLQLVDQSETILVLKLTASADGKVTAKIIRALKGKAPGVKLTIDLTITGQKEHAKAFAAMAVRRAGAPVLFFAGSYKEEAGAEPEAAALLQVDRDWTRLTGGRDHKWKFVGNDTGMQGTWDGGTDMLIRVVEYVIDNAGEADVPVAVGVNWAGSKVIGEVEGAVAEAMAVDLAGQGAISLFVASAGGDRLFQWDAKKKGFQDITAARKLFSKSKAAVWADFNGDGRADLLSWDGQRLGVRVQGADGCFPAKGTAASIELKDGCIGLAALDLGMPGKAGAAVSTPGGVLLGRLGKDGTLESAGPLDLGGNDPRTLGKSSRMLVADLNGDGAGDILQLFEKGSLLWRGKTGDARGFEAARKSLVATGSKGRSSACLGDYDMDGRLDVLTVGTEGCRLWNNRGGLKFVETFGHTGEMFTTAGPGGIACGTCDINNDGRQDAIIFYDGGIPLMFFNRGFRSFGKSLTLTEASLVEGIADTKGGQQAGVVEDFNGDGAQDMAVLLKNGDVMVFLRKTFDDEPPLAVRAVLPLGGPFAGPVTVTGRDGKRCLGAWNVVGGSSDAFIGMPDAGLVTLRWQLPGGKPQERRITLIDKVVRFAVGAVNRAPAVRVESRQGPPPEDKATPSGPPWSTSSPWPTTPS